MSTVTDAVVIGDSQRDASRFAVIYQRYAEQLYRYAYRRVGPRFAEDVVAETFLAAFRRRDAYDLSRPDARPWLFGIITREIARRRRAEDARYRAIARSGGGDHVRGFADDVTASVAAQATRAALAEALRGLSPGDRDVLLLVAWNDFSYEEVARTLGIKLGTVRSRLHRARRKVREALGDTNPIDIMDVDDE
jgi:RNA polymerase sigma-70 factor (ECF subfamily)